MDAGAANPFAPDALSGALDDQRQTMRQILTVHSPMSPGLLDALLTAVEGALVGLDASRMTAASRGNDIVVLAELPGER